jgi:glycosyltransferase involved in cell wall biosynthesis
VELTGVTHAAVLGALAEADLSIGKMKMGYYANLQIESMMAGVPTITHVRPEFMTAALRESGFIFATLDTLAETIEYYVTHPDALTDKRQRARASIQALHDNAAIARQYQKLYRGLRAGEGTAGHV